RSASPPHVGTDDPLRARTLVVQNGGRTMAVVGLDLVKIRLDLADAAIAEASKRTGIDRDAGMICPSHNHSSPFIPMGGPNNKDYIDTLPGLIADSIDHVRIDQLLLGFRGKPKDLSQIAATLVAALAAPAPLRPRHCR
ncbi:MAG: hypothetical protein CMJ48_04975, partial [Planctomycetaceae bacterium]|nr:hypothetical protein [Planctomycetaceae bacterium]